MTLLERMAQRAEAVAERRRQAVEAAWSGISGVAIRREEGRLILSGRGLIRRWLGEFGLRFARWNRS
jgi:hypothetical protein